jgi:hypothetical protein
MSWTNRLPGFNFNGDWGQSTNKLKTVHELDRPVVTFISPNMKTGPWIAGGAVLNWYKNQSIEDSDIDVFFKDQKQFDVCFGELMSKGKANMVYNSDNAITLHVHSDNGSLKRVQLIRKEWFSTAKEIIDKFDITVCQLVTDGHSLELGEKTAQHIKDHVLEFTKEHPHSDIVKRLIKYVTYGYVPKSETVKNIIENHHNFNWKFNGTESDYDVAF